MQVTLVSSDNQSFQVPEQVAKMSNTIKDTLEGDTRASDPAPDIANSLSRLIVGCPSKLD